MWGFSRYHIGKGWPPDTVMKTLSCWIKKKHLGASSNGRCCMPVIPIGHEMRERPLRLTSGWCSMASASTIFFAFLSCSCCSEQNAAYILSIGFYNHEMTQNFKKDALQMYPRRENAHPCPCVTSYVDEWTTGVKIKIWRKQVYQNKFFVH